MNNTLRAGLPESYHALLPAVFDGHAPREEKATCSSCAMCAPPGSPPAPDVVYFRPDVKCCSYQPILPNYLVGAILSDDRPDMAEGRCRIQAKIAARVGVTPAWLFPPKKLLVLFDASRDSSFGRSLMLRCPFYEAQGGLCTIWRHREGVCSSFYCKYMAGVDGQTFWRGHRDYLLYLERRLATYAVRALAPQLDRTYERRDRMTLEDLEDRPPSPASYSALWQGWEGREEEFYRACHERVAALGADDYERVVRDEELDRRHSHLKDAHQRLMKPELPARLVLNPEIKSREVDGGILATTYSTYEPLLLSFDLYAVLKQLRRDETVTDFRARLLREAELEVPEGMLLALYQMRVVVEA